VVNVERGGNFSQGYGPTGTTGTIDGTINLKATASGNAFFSNGYGYPVNGTGKIVGVNSGAYIRNYVTFGGGTLASTMTITGKNLHISNLVNKGHRSAQRPLDRPEATSSPSIIRARSAQRRHEARHRRLTNASGKTISTNGSPLRLGGHNYANAGTINVSNTTLEYAMSSFSSLGTINRTNVSRTLFQRPVRRQGRHVQLHGPLSNMTWYGGYLQNGNYDPTNPTPRRSTS
jgi:hypothetical protein